MLGLGFAGYREYSDHRLNSAEAVYVHLGLPTLAVIDQYDEGELKSAMQDSCGSKA